MKRINTKCLTAVFSNVYFILICFCLSTYSLSAQERRTESQEKRKSKSEKTIDKAPNDVALSQLVNRIMIAQESIELVKGKPLYDNLNEKTKSLCPNYPKATLSHLTKEEITQWVSMQFNEGLNYLDLIVRIKEEL